MIFAHHVVDALRGRRGRYTVLCKADRDSQRKVAAMVESAEKFDFGALVLEKSTDGKMFEIPEITEAEAEAWSVGLLPFPAPLCWFEFSVVEDKSAVSRSMLLIDSVDGSLKVYRFDFSPAPCKGMAVTFGDFTAKGDVVFWPGTFVELAAGADPRALNAAGSSAAYVVGHGERKLLRMLENDEINHYLTGRAPLKLALYLNMMLYSQSTETKTAELPKQSRVKELIRERKGLAALPAHRIVTIVPDRFMREAEREGKATHRPPRLHWRRSHLRHFDHQTGNAKWLPDHEHKGSRGWWVTLVARMLVGRAELGEMSHEYRVKR